MAGNYGTYAIVMVQVGVYGSERGERAGKEGKGREYFM